MTINLNRWGVFLAFCTILLFNTTARAQPKVYFAFVSHNEETQNWNNTPFYTLNRGKLVTIATYFKQYGVKWNMQSDWLYLNNVLKQETPALKALTGNKHILRWMHEDQGVEMDPHAHESQYLYPDVVYLMDSLGLPESKVMGGTIYNANNGMNKWTNLVNGQYGLKFPQKFWRPDYMMGGGTPNHVDDLKYYGFWNPQSQTNYLVHDTTSRLRHIGIGCDLKVETTSTVSERVSALRDVLQKVQSGQYPSDGFYVQNIFFEQADLNNPAFAGMLMQIADSVNTWVVAGKAEWKSLKEAYTQWETAYSARVFQWECGQLTATTTPELAGIKVYPNPFSEKILPEGLNGDENFVLWNALGACAWSGRQIWDQDFSGLSKGVYFLQVLGKNGAAVLKVVKE
ncbi:MAG: T9SS type A sorting domain-containing protein [Bacteroidetes bacterium]|nr:T9SS type A sorting domain-containing protein [Bacteroidota bacterium]